MFGLPVDVPPTPVATLATVASAATIEARHVADGARSRWDGLSALVQRVARAARQHPADAWVVMECLAVTVTGLATMTLLGTDSPASWGALVIALCVATQTRTRLQATASLELLPVVRSLFVGFAVVAVLSALNIASHDDLVSAGAVLALAGLVIVAVLVLRRGLRRPPRIVVVGDRTAISRAAMRWSDGSAHVVGGVLAGDQETRLQSIVGVPTVVGLEHVADWAQGRKADLVIITPSAATPGPVTRNVAWALERTGIPLAVADLVGDAAPHRVRARRVGMTSVLELSPTRPGAVQRAVKDALDRLLGLVLLVCASPFLVATMLLIRLDSRGAALFRQQRVGRDGRTFTMYKLRTMHVDAERLLVGLRQQDEGAGPLFKLHDDPRVTRTGRLLRRTSMDELPQLINVVKGQMSLVGPRPALPTEVAEYDEVERRRLAVKPGMTGLWQVSGRSDLDWETSIALDLHYVDNWRVCDDVLIGLRTIGVVIGARGAY